MGACQRRNPLGLASLRVSAVALAACLLCAHATDSGSPAPSATTNVFTHATEAEPSSPCPMSMTPYLSEPSPFGWPMAPADWSWEREDCWPSKYMLCGGKMQSPMDLDFTYQSSICPVDTRGENGRLAKAVEYKPQTGIRAEVSHYMGTVEAIGDFGTLKLVQGEFEATQVHITAPSLHKINETRYDAEMLVLHKPKGAPDALGKGVVVSVLYKTTPNGNSHVFNGFGFGKMHSKVDQRVPAWDVTDIIDVPLDMAHALQGPAYLYNGSVPVPPCTENINWFILGDVQPIGAHQVQKLKEFLANHIPDFYKHERVVHPRMAVAAECRKIEVNSLDIGGAFEDATCKAAHDSGRAHLSARCWDHLGACFSKRFSAADIITADAIQPPAGQAIPVKEFMHYKPVDKVRVAPDEYSIFASVPNHGTMGHLMLKGHIFFAHNISIKPISAHTINGVRNEAEINIEHVMFGDTYGQGLPGYIEDPHMVVVSVQVKQGRHSELFADLEIGDDAYHASIRDGTPYHVEKTIDLGRELGAALSGSWYWYSSNSTHPGCGNSIRWMVFETAIEASMEQLNSLHLKVSGYDSSQMPKSIPRGQVWKEHFPAFAVEANETDCENLPQTEFVYGRERPLWNYGNERCWNMKYPVCGAGMQQSPIDVPTDIEVGSDNFLHRISWKPVSDLRVSNTGHNIQVTNGQMGYTTFIGPNGIPDYYQVVQFHLHMPSEHLIGGKQYAAELHIVHQKQITVGHLADDPLDILVTGIMFDFGEQESPLLRQLFLTDGADFIMHEGQHAELRHPLDLARAVGPVLNGPFYRYEGGLTTPPCLEVVKWFVFETPLSMSQVQWLEFKKLYPNPANNRPIQPLNGRVVKKNSMEEGNETDYRFFLGREQAHDRREPPAQLILVPIIGTTILMSIVGCAMFVNEDSTRKAKSAGGLEPVTIGKRREYVQLPDKTPKAS